ncbi:MAG: cellulose biosynthesis protein BcsG [Oceanococcus sp.]
MGIWSLYFLSKLGLHSQALIAMDWRINLAFALILVMPLRPWLSVTRHSIAIPVGVALLYRESHLPPFNRFVAEFEAISQFDGYYLLELAGRFVSPTAVFVFFLAGVAYWMLSCKLRMGSFAMLGILLLPLHAYWLQTVQAPSAQPSLQQVSGRDTESPGTRLSTFFSDERLRQTRFEPLKADGAEFDIVLLHICSLAWDDLDALDMSQAALFQRAHIKFNAFNSAASYSGPAAIRLLRASCGQLPHEELYSPANSQCLLMQQLSQSGFQSRIAMNHTGEFGGFLNDLVRYGGGSSSVLASDDLPRTMRQFDGDPVYSDLAVLKKWAADAGERPEVLYYNSTSLHDGNRLLDQPRLSSIGSYPIRVQRLLEDLEGFLASLTSRPRPTVVVLIPEHGAALRGDDQQIAGLREIPTPSISLVPVMVFLAGLPLANTPLIIDEPTSYFALSELLARFVSLSPFAVDAPPLQNYVDKLPRTRYVAENNGMVVMSNRSQFLQRDPNGHWEVLSSGLGDRVATANGVQVEPNPP